MGLKRSPLKRRVSLRDSYLRKLRAEGSKLVRKPNGQLTRKRSLKKLSRSRRTKLQHYYVLQQAFLKRVENASCGVCRALREAGENILLQSATEVHHRRGRVGRLLCDERYWLGCCYAHRLWPHEHPARARELGLLAPAAQWNVSA